jgi:hypothetical protein
MRKQNVSGQVKVLHELAEMLPLDTITHDYAKSFQHSLCECPTLL